MKKIRWKTVIVSLIVFFMPVFGIRSRCVAMPNGQLIYGYGVPVSWVEFYGRDQACYLYIWQAIKLSGTRARIYPLRAILGFGVIYFACEIIRNWFLKYLPAKEQTDTTSKT